MKSLYVDPEYDLAEEDDTLMPLYNTPNPAVYNDRKPLPPRDPATFTVFNKKSHQEILDAQI